MRSKARLLALAAAIATAPCAADPSLLDAVQDRNLAAARNLLDAGGDPNALWPDGSTALAWAIDNQDTDMARLLITRGAKPNVGSATTQPLVIACQYGDRDTIELVLSAGAHVTTARPDGITPLSLCAGSAPPAILERMIEMGAIVEAADAQGQTPLMWAAAHARIDNMKVLLAHGAQINRATHRGFTPLLFALKSGDPRAPLAVLDAGGNADYVAPDGTSVVQLAMYQKQYDFAARMIERGADLAAFDREGHRLLHAAVLANQPALVASLLAKGADANATTGPSKVQRRFEVNFTSAPYAVPPKSALLLAAEAGLADIMRTLVTAGADPKLRAPDGTNVVLAAASSGRLAALAFALQLAPDPNVTDASGQTPLHHLMFVGTGADIAPMMQLLASKGARPDIKNRAGKSPADLVPDAQTDAKTAFAATFDVRKLSRL